MILGDEVGTEICSVSNCVFSVCTAFAQELISKAPTCRSKALGSVSSVRTVCFLETTCYKQDVMTMLEEEVKVTMLHVEGEGHIQAVKLARAE